MTLLHRRVLYLSCILFFLILTPAILLYASGYEFDFTSGQVRRAGILILQSQPKGAAISLGDGRKYNWFYEFFYQDSQLKTPQKLRNLLPDEYDLTLTKDGYFDYRRPVKINAGQTVTLDNIILFRRSQPAHILEKNIINSRLSYDGSKLAALSPDSLSIIELNTGEIKEILFDKERLESSIAEIFWAPSDKKILLTYRNYPIFNIETGVKEAEIISYFPKNIQKIIWDSFSDNKLYIKQKNFLYQFDLVQKKVTLASNLPLADDFLAYDDTLLAITKANDNYFLALTSLKSGKEVKSIVLPAASAYKFFEAKQNLIYLYDSKRATLVFVDPWSLLPAPETINNIKDFAFVGANKMLYRNDFEIWLYDSETKEKLLITRVSEPIVQVWPQPDVDSYFFYSTRSTINAVEFQNKDYLNITKILDTQNINSPEISPDGRYIYFVSGVDSSRGLYKLDIK